METVRHSVEAGATEPMPVLVPVTETRAPAQPLPALQVTETTPATTPLSAVDYEDMRVKKNSAWQIEWNEWMSDVQKNSSIYKHVAVLLISWDKECDSLNVHDEVAELEKTFREKFNYKVLSIKLNSERGPLPQVVANSKVANFVLEEDREDSLLIVYYAGHGKRGNQAGQLMLFGQQKTDGSTPHEVLWNQVEANLHTTRGDVLEILDCCYAGDLGRGTRTFEPYRTEVTGLSTRCFEYIGATSSMSTTRSPGHHSFTRGLIWALGKYAESPTSRFTTSDLASKIKSFPNFPPEQVPHLSKRNPSSTENIVLSALPPSESQDPTESWPAPTVAPEYLDLRFYFKREPTLEDLKRLADMLRKHMVAHDTPLRRVSFEGLHSLIQKTLRRWSQKRSSRKSLGPLDALAAGISPSSSPSTPTVEKDGASLARPVQQPTPESGADSQEKFGRKRRRSGVVESDDENRSLKSAKMNYT